MTSNKTSFFNTTKSGKAALLEGHLQFFNRDLENNPEVERQTQINNEVIRHSGLYLQLQHVQRKFEKILSTE